MVAKGTSLLLLLLLVVSAVSGQSFSRMNRLSTTKHRWLLKFNNSTSMNNNATGELCMGNATYCPDRMTLVEDDDDEVDEEDDVLERDGGPETRRNWYESVPMPPIVVATSRTLPEGACKRQLTRYLEALGNGTLWATQSEYCRLRLRFRACVVGVMGIYGNWVCARTWIMIELRKGYGNYVNIFMSVIYIYMRRYSNGTCGCGGG